MADVTRRSRAAQLCAFFALVSALLGALGPAEKRTTTYDWPPADLPSGKPSSAWYTPLLLTRHRAEAVSADVPCRLPPALPDTGSTILATARFPERSDTLAVSREQRALVVRIGGREIVRAPLADASADEECAYRLSLADGRWTLEGGPRALAEAGSLPAMPVVTGLFSELDLGAGEAPTIRVTTPVQGSKPRPHQKVAWAFAALAAAAALALVAFPHRPRPRRALRRGARTARGRLRAADAVVVGALLAWWVLSPAFHDDGWVVARQRTFGSSGGFALYYNAFGVHLPGAYWLEWAQHWLSESTSALVLLRIPALVFLVATWVLARWILSRAVPASTPHERVALWTLSTGFLVGAFAWGMTLRPEPVSALLVTAALACVVRFRERETAAPLAALAVVMPFALTGHQAAVAAFAPLLASIPALVPWVRSRIADASTIFASAFALFAVLLFVGSDLEQRSADAQTLAGFTGASWRTEIHRYTSLAVFPFGTPLRRAFVALALLAVAAYLFRRSPRSQPLLDLPAASLGLSALLLIATPTKFPWHFGALIGVVAIALAAEIVRLREESRSASGSVAKPLVVIGAVVVGAAWAWAPRTGWSTLDLRTLDWRPAIETWLPVATLATLLPVAVLVALALAGFLRNRKAAAHAPWRTVPWLVPLVAVPLLVFTFAVLAADAVRTDTWTLTRQNLGALTGDAGCGLADTLEVPAAVAAQAPFPTDVREPRSLALWTPTAPVAGLPRFSLGPGGSQPARTPWFRIGETRFGLYVAGTPRSSDRLELEWGRTRGASVLPLARQRITTPFSNEAGASLPWRFVSAGELPQAAPGANAVRIALRSDAAPGAALAVTAPVRYTATSLAAALQGDSRPLVLPNLVTYLPCVELPRLGDGIAEPPSHIVTPADAPSPVREPDSSPFAGVLDLYELERLPLADSADPPRDIAVFRVDREIPGALEAPPTSTAGG